MLKLKGLTPDGVRHADGRALLRWTVDGKQVETDFDRFRPVGLRLAEASPGPSTEAGTAPRRSLEITWGDMGDLPLTDAFYKISIERAAANAYTAERFRTGQDTLRLAAAEPSALPFTGAVFHMARTGSTLIHRLLGKVGRVQSVSEIALIDRALMLTEPWDAGERATFLHDLIGAFCKARRPAERQFVTKMTDAGACIRLPLFRQAFPGLPWVFVYREPIEVMVSVLTKPSGNIEGWYRNRLQTARRLGMPELGDPGMWPEEFMARTLRRFCSAAVEAARQTPKGLFLAVPYPRLPDATWETVAEHFGVALTDRDRDVMRAEARYSAKGGDAEFKSDSAKKRDLATPYMRKLADQLVGPMIEELRALPQA